MVSIYHQFQYEVNNQSLIILTCHGQSPGLDSLPPTILDWPFPLNPQIGGGAFNVSSLLIDRPVAEEKIKQ